MSTSPLVRRGGTAERLPWEAADNKTLVFIFGGFAEAKKKKDRSV